MAPDQSSSNTAASAIRRRRPMSSLIVLCLAVASSLTTSATAFSTGRHVKVISSTPSSRRMPLQMANSNNSDDILRPILSTMTTASLAFTLAIASTTTTSPLPANAYEESDYASETVTNVVSQLKSNAGNVDGTFTTLEEVAKIITEGKGVGGTLTYDGVKLTEGFVADEDTTIYNPGLSLLTSSEKERLVSAIIDNRKIGLSTQQWSENNEYAFDFLKTKLDPLHMYELEGYLKVLPFWGAALYLVALFVQKNARGIFPLVYGLCALGVFGPVFLLVASGP